MRNNIDREALATAVRAFRRAATDKTTLYCVDRATARSHAGDAIADAYVVRGFYDAYQELCDTVHAYLAANASNTDELRAFILATFDDDEARLASAVRYYHAARATAGMPVNLSLVAQESRDDAALNWYVFAYRVVLKAAVTYRANGASDTDIDRVIAETLAAMPAAEDVHRDACARVFRYACARYAQQGDSLALTLALNAIAGNYRPSGIDARDRATFTVVGACDLVEAAEGLVDAGGRYLALTIATRALRDESPPRRIVGRDADGVFADDVFAWDAEPEPRENPKAAFGRAKVSASVVPRNVLAELAVAMSEGARKYGRHNWRDVGIVASDYFDAAGRHLNSWWEGEDMDPGTQGRVHHVTKAIATLTVLRDAMLCGQCIDDRPPATVQSGWIDAMNDAQAALVTAIPTAKPAVTAARVSS